MLTNKITISDDLLNTVRGILGEAKKCPADCECEKCEAEEMEEGYASAAQRKAVWANRADDGAGHPDKKKKLKEEILEMVNEASSGLADKAKKSGVSLSTLKKVYARGIAAWNSGHRPGTTPQQWAHARVNSYITKGKGTYHGADKDLRSEGTDMPFKGPYKEVGDRKDEYGNKVKNVAKFLAKKAMNDLAKKNEEAEHNNCGTPECCGQCDTTGQIDETAKIVAHLRKRYGDNIRKSHVRSAASDFGVDASKLAKAVRIKLGKNMLDEEDDGWYTHSQMHGSKKSEKHPKGISAAEWKSGIRWHHGKNKRINIKEEAEQIDELSDTYSAPARVPQKMIKPEAARRMANTANRKNMSDKDIETVIFNQGHGRKSLKLINQLRKEESEQIDEISKATMGRYINKAADRMSTQGVTAGLKIAADEKSKKNFDTIAKRQKGIATAVSKLTKEEQDFVDSLNDADIEQIDELSDTTLKSYAKKAMDQATSAHGYQKDAEKSGDHDRARREMKHKWKRQAGARNAIDRLGGNNTLAKEEAEQIDEISKNAALKYLAANKKDDAKARETGDFDRMTKRMRGTDMAVRKYTAKPGSKSVRVPATEEVELDEAHDGYKTNSEKSKFNSGHRAKLMNPEGKPAYLSQKSYNTPAHAKAAAKFYGSIMHLPIRTIDSKMSDYNKAYDAKHGDVKESVELDEARGRPRKAGAKDFTIHPKTKEKLMHNNPADMKTIEVLQKNGILEKPKIEAGQHIMNQLSKAKTSMLGGSKIHFTHGDSKEVSGTHAAKILTKYAGMRPNEKEDFQKFVGHSHENLMKHV